MKKAIDRFDDFSIHRAQLMLSPLCQSPANPTSRPQPRQSNAREGCRNALTRHSRRHRLPASARSAPAPSPPPPRARQAEAVTIQALAGSSCETQGHEAALETGVTHAQHGQGSHWRPCQKPEEGAGGCRGGQAVCWLLAATLCGTGRAGHSKAGRCWRLSVCEQDEKRALVPWPSVQRPSPALIALHHSGR